jgi:uncharacterized protein
MADDASVKTVARTNRLVQSTSPYLLQHSHNPVDWYPWGPEALARAREQDKPIFLSIGYSACHWCHVMERESFENEEIAGILNEAFVPIKVDREERPDLDELYMKATLLYNQGNGGWPMSVFLTPGNQEPFFAGTYFPPTARYGHPGFKEVLLHIARLWRDDREKIHQSAGALSQAVRQFIAPVSSDGPISREVVVQAVSGLGAAFDPSRGGLLSGQRNKFPPSLAMSLMLREHHRGVQDGKPNPLLLDRVLVTLDHMANGGIYDHLAGGVARYSTDPDWLVPHFEKMLYDQAQVSGAYLGAFQVTGDQRYAEVASEILDYVLREMRDSEGGFHSAWDADSEGQEGKYYVWSKSEVMSVLGDRLGPVFCSYYDVTDAGNWEGHNILNVQRDVETVARLHGLPVAELSEMLQEGREKLLAARARRVPPGLDDKILTSWNGLMISSLARGARTLGQDRYAEAAREAADFILTHLTHDGRLLRAYRKGQAHTGGYLDDYAFFVESLIELHQTLFDYRWLEEAVRLNDEMVRHFWDERDGGFFLAADDAEPLFVRAKESRDGVIPSGYSVAVMNLLRLATILDRDDFRDLAERSFRAVAGEVDQSPFGRERLLEAMDAFCTPTKEVVIIGSQQAAETGRLIAASRRGYDPYRIVLLLDPAAPGAEEWRGCIPSLAGKKMLDGKPTAYLCVNRTCGRPVTMAEELAAVIR